MKLYKKSYKSKDVVELIFQISPFCTTLYVILSIIIAIISTAATTLTTAGFVDTAIDILQGEKNKSDIYLPLAMLMLVLGLNLTLNDVVSLVISYIRLQLQRKLDPVMVKIHASMDYKYIENDRVWGLISRVSTNPCEMIINGFSSYMIILIVILRIISVLVLIIKYVWWAPILVILFSIPTFWLSTRAGKKTYEASCDAEIFRRRTNYLDEVLTGRDCIEERSLFRYTSNISKLWKEQFDSGLILQLKVNAKQLLIAKGSSICLNSIIMFIGLILINPVLLGQLSAGMYMGIVGGVAALIYQMGWMMSGALQTKASVGEYMKDFTKYINMSKANEVLCEPDSEPINFSSIEFRNVRFKYPNSEEYIIDGLSFTLYNGQHYAFVGKNGSGKTTIIKLMTGLYTDYEGEILINGKELRTYSYSTLKALFSIVQQDFAKYYISLRENILFGDISGTDVHKRINQAVIYAGLEKTLANLKNGIDTPLGKIKVDGQDLSGGQWQRIAIARSLISRAPVKIFDEPTAALDPIAESQIYADYERLMAKKTTVFISHRLGSTKLADEILVIDDGIIIERGTHDELMNKRGKYFDMFEAQRSWYQ